MVIINVLVIKIGIFWDGLRQKNVKNEKNFKINKLLGKYLCTIEKFRLLNASEIYKNLKLSYKENIKLKIYLLHKVNIVIRSILVSRGVIKTD